MIYWIQVELQVAMEVWDLGNQEEHKEENQM